LDGSPSCDSSATITLWHLDAGSGRRPPHHKQPHLFTAADGSPILAFAGLWDKWRDPMSGEDVLSCTIIVSDASAWMAPYHDRMPVLLATKDFDAWLGGTLGADALRPAAGSALREWPVSKRMNRTGEGDDDPTVIDQNAA
jgi:putative SOS response-associated peptidase YedK